MKKNKPQVHAFFLLVTAASNSLNVSTGVDKASVFQEKTYSEKMETKDNSKSTNNYSSILYFDKRIKKEISRSEFPYILIKSDDSQQKEYLDGNGKLDKKYWTVVEDVDDITPDEIVTTELFFSPYVTGYLGPDAEKEIDNRKGLRVFIWEVNYSTCKAQP